MFWQSSKSIIIVSFLLCYFLCNSNILATAAAPSLPGSSEQRYPRANPKRSIKKRHPWIPEEPTTPPDHNSNPTTTTRWAWGRPPNQPPIRVTVSPPLPTEYPPLPPLPTERLPQTPQPRPQPPQTPHPRTTSSEPTGTTAQTQSTVTFGQRPPTRPPKVVTTSSTATTPLNCIPVTPSTSTSQPTSTSLPTYLSTSSSSTSSSSPSTTSDDVDIDIRRRSLNVNDNSTTTSTSSTTTLPPCPITTTTESTTSTTSTTPSTTPSTTTTTTTKKPTPPPRTTTPDPFKEKTLQVVYEPRAKSNIPYYLAGGGFASILICIIFTCLIINKVICYEYEDFNDDGGKTYTSVKTNKKPKRSTKRKSAEATSAKKKKPKKHNK